MSDLAQAHLHALVAAGCFAAVYIATCRGDTFMGALFCAGSVLNGFWMFAAAWGKL